MPLQPASMTSERAEEIAIKALTYLSNDPELMGRFLALSGLDPTGLKDVITEPSFLAGLLDFLLMDDSVLLTFISNFSLDPHDVVSAKAVLDPMSHAATGAL